MCVYVCVSIHEKVYICIFDCVVGVLTLAFKDCFAHVQTDKPVHPPSIDPLGVFKPSKYEIQTLIKMFAPPPSHTKLP